MAATLHRTRAELDALKRAGPAPARQATGNNKYVLPSTQTNRGGSAAGGGGGRNGRRVGRDRSLGGGGEGGGTDGTAAASTGGGQSGSEQSGSKQFGSRQAGGVAQAGAAPGQLPRNAYC